MPTLINHYVAFVSQRNSTGEVRGCNGNSGSNRGGQWHQGNQLNSRGKGIQPAPQYN